MLWSKLFLFPIICCWAQSPISVRSSSRTVQQANVTQASATVPTPTPVSTALHHAAVSVFSKHWPLSSAIRPSPTPVVASSPSASACGGVFNGISGEINVISTYYSGYCYWDIHSPLMNSSILLVVEHFQRQYCWNYYVATRNGRYRYFCGQKEPFAFLVSGSYAQVRLRSYYYYQMTLKTFYAVMNNDFLVSYQRDWNVTVGNISSTTVNVSWLPLNSSSLNSTDIYGYVTVCLRNGGSDILPLSVENASLASNTVVRNLKPYSNYKVKVVALLKDRVTGVITLKSSEKTDIRTKEDVPGYVPRVNGRNRGFDSLEIYWYPIPEEDTHGVLLGYIVYFRRYGSYENFTTVKVDASTRVYIITGLLEATRYEIKVAGRTSVGEGPLRTTYESTGCGGTFNGTKGEINVTSSHYSGYCYWEIYSPLANSSILLVFQRFQIEYCWVMCKSHYQEWTSLGQSILQVHLERFMTS